MPADLVPFGTEVGPALEMAREALWAACPPGEDPAAYWPALEAGIRSRAAPGALWVRDGEVLGIALWDRPGPLGVALSVLYLRGAEVSVAGYRALLASVGGAAGPIAFVSSPVPGLETRAEAALMGELGFAPFSRSEFSLDLARPRSERPMPSDLRRRPYRPEDSEAVARIHRHAYDGRFDRYLFLEDLDPARDAEALVRDLVRGRWGEFLAPASFVVEERGEPVGASLVVRTARGPLIANVVTDPAHATRGIGRAALEGTIGALVDQGEPRVRLVVTEGNRPALALYERLGFVRTRGPSLQWYNTGRIPVGPG